MNTKHAALAAAAAAVLAAPAFAQGGATVTSSTGASVNSAAGVAVTPGVPDTTVVVTPSTSVAVPGVHLLPGGATVQASSTTTLGGPAGTANGSKTVVTHYWVNVPANVERRADFQRWRSLK